MFKPMLACSTIPKFSEIKYPVLASPKLDGIRCLIIDGKPVSRNLKPIPNKFIQDELGKLNLPELDGELMIRTGDFNSVQSAVMSESGRPDFVYVVFDYWQEPKLGYARRITNGISLGLISERVQYINNQHIHNALQMEQQYNEWLEQGYEGAIVRDPYGPYKFGRSTMNQGWMLKLKTFNDAEAEIIGFEELMHNDNEATIDKLGHQVRSSHQAGQYGGNTLGALVVKFQDKEFKIGTGFDASERSRLWHVRDKLIGKLVTFKYQELSKYGIPRFPVYKGIRYKGDL